MKKFFQTFEKYHSPYQFGSGVRKILLEDQ